MISQINAYVMLNKDEVIEGYGRLWKVTEGYGGLCCSCAIVHIQCVYLPP
jgi:hypothetical protein